MIAERYVNKLYKAPGQPEGAVCARYWVNGMRIMVGGSIVDPVDAEHLHKDFGITRVLSVETEHDDIGRTSPFLSAARFAFPDGGLLFLLKLFWRA